MSFRPYQRVMVGDKLGRTIAEGGVCEKFIAGRMMVRVYFDEAKGIKSKKNSVPVVYKLSNEIEEVPITWKWIKTQYGGENKEHFGDQTCRHCRRILEENEKCWYSPEEAHGFRTVCIGCESTIDIANLPRKLQKK